jgi:hypothetical protein
MNLKTALTCAALGAALAGPAMAADTLLGSGTLNGRTYSLYQAGSASGTITWSDAEAAAVLLGGHLASVADLTESDFIYSIVAPHVAALYRPDGFNQLGPWIGGVKVSGVFTWSDGTPFSFTHWAFGEPNNVNGFENNIHLFANNGDPVDEPGEGSFWNDLSGNNNTIRGYVVETAASAGVPEPGAWALMILGFGAAGAMLRRRAAVAA